MADFEITWRNPDKAYWDFKQKCIAHLLTPSWDANRVDVLQAISGKRHRDAAVGRCTKFWNSIPKPHNNYFYIFEDIYYKLVCLSQNTPLEINSETTRKIVELMCSTPEKFCDLLHEDYKNDAKNFLGRCNPRIVPNIRTQNSPKMPSTSIGGIPAFFQSDIPDIDLEKCAADKKIDQRTFYLRPKSAQNWEQFGKNPKYGIYRKCEDALIKMLSTEKFIQDFSSQEIDKVVMLGGAGCHSKDICILSMLGELPQFDHSNPLTFLLFDISQWMLSGSLGLLAPAIKNTSANPWAENIILRAGVGDMMKMRRLKGHFRRDSTSILWGLTGAIFANVSECDLMDSLNDVAEAGDLLMISVSILKEDIKPEPVNYSNNKQSQVMVRGPLSDLFAEKELRSKLQKINGRNYNVDDVFHDELMEDRISDHGTDVPSSHATEVFCRLPTKNQGRIDVVLHTHVQYNVEALKKFMKMNGEWEFKQLIASNISADYAQIVFQKAD